MKKLAKIILITIASLIGLVLLFAIVTVLCLNISAGSKSKKSMALAYPEVKTITADGITFRDLNKNGNLDIYEDLRRQVSQRVEDLLSQMTLEEKAGCMFITMISMKPDGSVSEKPSLSDPFSLMMLPASDMLFRKNMNHFNILYGTGKREMAIWYNNIQKLAERTRLGIPVTIASDPRNHFSVNPLAAALAGDFSMFPEPIGLAAIGDSATAARFADIARQEYLATGIRIALHPMADLATEPRWGRINGTFGEDANLSAKLTYAYIKGFQGDTLGPRSVACMTKHFSGGGPQKEGIDPHFKVQKGQVYPGNNFKYHLIPFEAAFRAGTASIMPYYGIPTDQASENVAFAFNKDIITGLLRNTYNFDGIVCTDWGVLTDWKVFGFTIMPARAWGMTDATVDQRAEKVLKAGCDMFGGEAIPDVIVKLVKDGRISETIIDSAVRRILKLKFVLGLFDNPFVDIEKAAEIVGNPEFKAAAEKAQRKSVVLLKNDTLMSKPVLPLSKGLKLYPVNIDPAVVSEFGIVAGKPEDADFAIVRLKAPSYPLKGTGILGRLFSSGDLDFKGREKQQILDILKKVPSIVDIYLDRPAVIPEIAAASKGLFANFGASDRALLDIVFGVCQPVGRLPFELPSSMDAVRKQKEDLPYDSENPLFNFGFGLKY